jgi:uncharacterized protein
MQDNLKTVEAIYAAFGRGDVKAILETLADDVDWEVWSANFAQAEGVPWLQPKKGRAKVAEFFDYIGKWKFGEFHVLSLLAGGNQVAAEIQLDAEITQTGGRLREEEIHLWTFNDKGQVTRYRHYADTAKHIAAWRGKR